MEGRTRRTRRARRRALPTNLAPSAHQTTSCPPRRTTTADASEPETTPPEPSLFSGSSIPLITLELSDPATESLGEEPKTYVPGTFHLELDGAAYDLAAVGVRLKGGAGSFRTLDAKAAFLLHFSKYSSGRRLFGMRKLALNNMVQDRSMIHERLGYSLFREGDVPAPQSAYAWVRVNGVDYGLYATVEVVDNPSFLERWFGDASGNLYEGQYGTDLVPDKMSGFDQDNGEDVGGADLVELRAALDGMTNPATVVDELSQVIDLDRYLELAATEIWIGHWDGYAWTRNNYYLYRRPDDGRWTFIPWGIDQTFKDTLDPFGGTGRIQKMCDASLACRERLAEAFERVSARADALGLADAIQTTRDLIWDAAMTDPRKEVGEAAMTSAIAGATEFVAARPAQVASALACTNPSDVDEDGDGASGCDADCDDADPTVHPGAEETCNLRDDDCNGVWDDAPQCPPCVIDHLGERSYAFCFHRRGWEAAEADCVEQGGHLASIHSGEEQAWLWTRAAEVSDDHWWVGLDDLATEGHHEWIDGTPVDFLGWAKGEPNNAAGGEDCVTLTSGKGGQWNDFTCKNDLFYICESPLPSH